MVQCSTVPRSPRSSSFKVWESTMQTIVGKWIVSILFSELLLFFLLTIGFVFRHHQTLYTFSTPFPNQTKPYVHILLLLNLLLQLLLLIAPDLESSLLIWTILSESPETTPSIYVVPTFEKVVNRIAGKITHLECRVLHPTGCRLTGVRAQLCTGKKIKFHDYHDGWYSK